MYISSLSCLEWDTEVCRDRWRQWESARSGREGNVHWRIDWYEWYSNWRCSGWDTGRIKGTDYGMYDRALVFVLVVARRQQEMEDPLLLQSMLLVSAWLHSELPSRERWKMMKVDATRQRGNVHWRIDWYELNWPHRFVQGESLMSINWKYVISF